MNKRTREAIARIQQLKPWQNIEWLKKLYPPQTGAFKYKERNPNDQRQYVVSHQGYKVK